MAKPGYQPILMRHIASSYKIVTGASRRHGAQSIPWLTRPFDIEIGPVIYSRYAGLTKEIN